MPDLVLRAVVALAAVLTVAAAVRLWKRPPRVSRLDLAEIGVLGPAIVQFSTEQCAPCKEAAPHLEAAARETDVRYAQIDVGERPEVARRYGIRTVPTIVVAGRRGHVLGTWTSLPGNGEIVAVARRARTA